MDKYPFGSSESIAFYSGNDSRPFSVKVDKKIDKLVRKHTTEACITNWYMLVKNQQTVPGFCASCIHLKLQSKLFFFSENCGFVGNCKTVAINLEIKY